MDKHKNVKDMINILKQIFRITWASCNLICSNKFQINKNEKS